MVLANHLLSLTRHVWKCKKMANNSHLFNNIRYAQVFKVLSSTTMSGCYSTLENIRTTIFAPSSGVGKCGVAVIRVSGHRSFAAVEEIGRMNKIWVEPIRSYLKNLYHPVSNELLDKGLVLWFPGEFLRWKCSHLVLLVVSSFHRSFIVCIDNISMISV